MPQNSELITVFLLLTGKFFGRGGSDDGAGFKAALLSGPPGIGKTTTATLVCKVGYLLYEPRHEKTNILVFDLVRHKPSCTATEDG